MTIIPHKISIPINPILALQDVRVLPALLSLAVYEGIYVKITPDITIYPDSQVRRVLKIIHSQNHNLRNNGIRPTLEC